MQLQVIEVQDGKKTSSDIFPEFLSVQGAGVWLGNGLATVCIDLDKEYYEIVPAGTSTVHSLHLKIKEVKP